MFNLQGFCNKTDVHLCPIDLNFNYKNKMEWKYGQGEIDCAENEYKIRKQQVRFS